MASNSGDSSASHIQVIVTAAYAELLSTVKRHLFSAFLGELSWTANHQLTTELPTTPNKLTGVLII
jgi:hypothetical protein